MKTMHIISTVLAISILFSSVQGCTKTQAKPASVSASIQKQLFEKYYPEKDSKGGNLSGEDFTWKDIMQNSHDLFRYTNIMEIEVLNRSDKDCNLGDSMKHIFYNAKVRKSYYGSLKEGDQIIILQSDHKYYRINSNDYVAGTRFIAVFNSYSNFIKEVKESGHDDDYKKLDWEYYYPVDEDRNAYIENFNGTKYVKFDENNNLNAIDLLKTVNIVLNSGDLYRFKQGDKSLSFLKLDCFEKFLLKKSIFESSYQKGPK